MTTKVRMVVAGLALAAGVALIYSTGPSYAGGKDMKGAIMKIADAIKKGDTAAAKKMAKAAAKSAEEIADVMHMFRPRSKGGMGVGPTKGANAAKDGIEAMIRDYARDVPSKPAAGLEVTGYWIAAIAEITAAKAPTKDQGKKTKKNWATWAEEMRVAGLDFAKAGAAGGGAGIKTAASKVNNSCNSCHSVFKD